MYSDLAIVSLSHAVQPWFRNTFAVPHTHSHFSERKFTSCKTSCWMVTLEQWPKQHIGNFLFQLTQCFIDCYLLSY